jgi:hypothetical protein
VAAAPADGAVTSGGGCAAVVRPTPPPSPAAAAAQLLLVYCELRRGDVAAALALLRQASGMGDGRQAGA